MIRITVEIEIDGEDDRAEEIIHNVKENIQDCLGHCHFDARTDISSETTAD